MSCDVLHTHTHTLRTHTHTPLSGEDEGRYVQDGMRRHSKDLAQWVLQDKAVVYVCG